MNTAIMLPLAADGLKIRFCLYDWVHYYGKMLYDNALLARVYLHAWQVTGEPAFRRIVDETLGFVTREMIDSQGGFYSPLDADRASFTSGPSMKFALSWATNQIFLNRPKVSKHKAIGKGRQFYNARWMTRPSPPVSSLTSKLFCFMCTWLRAI